MSGQVTPRRPPSLSDPYRGAVSPGTGAAVSPGTGEPYGYGGYGVGRDTIPTDYAEAEARSAAPYGAAGEAGGSVGNKRSGFCMVTFVAIGSENVRQSLTVEENRVYALGRESSVSELVLNAQDRKLSGRHCSIRVQGQCLEILDEGSRNGTYVDGAPIRGAGVVRVQSGQNIRMGSYEYRVMVQPLSGR